MQGCASAIARFAAVVMHLVNKSSETQGVVHKRVWGKVARNSRVFWSAGK